MYIFQAQSKYHPVSSPGVKNFMLNLSLLVQLIATPTILKTKPKIDAHWICLFVIG